MAGESAQREYERLRQLRRERIRASWPRIIVVVSMSFVLGWLLPLLVLSGASSLIGSVAGGTQTINVQVPPIAVSLMVSVTFALAATSRLLGPSQTEVSWGKGANGERTVGAALDALAAREGLVTLHDRRMPRSQANIDHLVVARTGVFTIDAKQYAGRIQVRGRGRELWIAGRNRSKLLDQARRQSAVTSDVLEAAGFGSVVVTPVLCFVGTTMPRLFRQDQVAGVLLTTPGRLGAILTDGATTVDAARTASIADALDTALPPAVDGPTATPPRRPAAATSSRVDPSPGARRPTPPSRICDRCGDALVVRRRRRDGAPFLGCSAFPRCRNTAPLPDG